MSDNTQSDTPTPLTSDLKDKGKQQLEAEITILETWLVELDETSDDNSESVTARKTYLGMVHSRKELLEMLLE